MDIRMSTSKTIIESLPHYPKHALFYENSQLRLPKYNLGQDGDTCLKQLLCLVQWMPKDAENLKLAAVGSIWGLGVTRRHRTRKRQEKVWGCIRKHLLELHSVVRAHLRVIFTLNQKVQDMLCEFATMIH